MGAGPRRGLLHVYMIGNSARYTTEATASPVHLACSPGLVCTVPGMLPAAVSGRGPLTAATAGLDGLAVNV